MALVNELISKIYERLEDNNVFWTPAEVIVNGINPAMRLMAIHDPELIIRRTALSLVADQCFIDLRDSSTSTILKIHRVVVGNDTSDPVVNSQGRFYRLRPATVNGLRTKGDWLQKRMPYPTHYWRYGLYWFGIHPRPTLDHTITLIYSAIPTTIPTGTTSNNIEVDIPETWTSMIPEIAAALLIMKEGQGESLEAIKLLQRVLIPEDMRKLSAGLEKIQKKMIYGRDKESVNAA